MQWLALLLKTWKTMRNNGASVSLAGLRGLTFPFTGFGRMFFRMNESPAGDSLPRAFTLLVVMDVLYAYYEVATTR